MIAYTFPWEKIDDFTENRLVPTVLRLVGLVCTY